MRTRQTIRDVRGAVGQRVRLSLPGFGHRRCQANMALAPGGLQSHASTSTSPPQHTVICGGGVIGAACAFYLAEMGLASRVTLVEREGVACAASGKAGGFLALDWNDSGPSRELSRTSYALHAELADIFGAERIGYRAVNTLSVAAVERGLGSGMASPPGRKLLPHWVDGPVVAAAGMGSKKTTAQVHPALLTHALVDSAVERGAKLMTATVTGLQLGPTDNAVTGVHVTSSSAAGGVAQEVLAADAVLLAMGPWTDVAAARWGLPLPRITGTKYHSVVLQPDPLQPQATADCLFTQFEYKSGREAEPEVYPRPDGTVYVCGEPQGLPLPDTAAQVTVDEGLAANVLQAAHCLSSLLRGAHVAAKQACYLPNAPDGIPVIGCVPDHPGVFVATGHTCWGILNAPATGKACAELIAHGQAKTVDLTRFQPNRFMEGARPMVKKSARA
ncbi:FAD dependent oxidoreductase [Haematococcus lacustris]